MVAIGNAPTALFRLLDMLDAGAAKPSAILGLPVGFVQKMKHALRVSGSFFTARRMLQEYVTKYYVPAVCGDVTADDPPTA